MKKTSFISVLIITISCCLQAKEHRIYSPDRNLVLSVIINDKIYYSISYKNVQMIDQSPLALTIEGKPMPAPDPVVLEIKHKLINEKIKPAVKEKRSEIINHCNEITFVFADSCGIIFRAYNDGIAWRFFTTLERTILVDDEEVTFKLTNNDSLYIPVVPCYENNDSNSDCFHTAYENLYEKIMLPQGLTDALGLLPALVYPEDERPKMLIAESDVEDYPGMYLTNGNQGYILKGIFPAYPDELKLVMPWGFKWNTVVKRAYYIAKTTGTRQFPWRIVVFAEEDKALAECDIVLRLSGKSRIEDTSWIKTGKSTSEWLYSNHIYGVDFKAGYNTDTYKFYIDFAKQFGLEYVLFDAGWSNPNDLFDLTPEMDMEVLTRYARERDVGLVLWTSSASMETQMEQALRQFQEWGIKGIMVDYFNRDDQLIIDFLQEIAEKAAAKQIFVDFHGVSKPEGIRGKFPNVLTREGFVAYEYYKWSKNPSPEYEVTIPYIRMVAGPMDYEPGAMRNAQRREFHAIDDQPMSMGTRIHQLAMFIAYDSPYAKMGGNPSDYLKEPEYTQFIADIPTVWEETRVLDGRVADYIVTLRQAENGDFYIGAMTDWNPREIEISYDFLEEGIYNITIYQDGINADTYGSDYKSILSKITCRSRQLIKMAPGGGWVAHISKENH